MIFLTLILTVRQLLLVSKQFDQLTGRHWPRGFPSKRSGYHGQRQVVRNCPINFDCRNPFPIHHPWLVVSITEINRDCPGKFTFQLYGYVPDPSTTSGPGMMCIEERKKYTMGA